MTELKKVRNTENFFTKEYPKDRIITLTEVEMKKRADKEDADSNIIEKRPESTVVQMEAKEPEVQEKKKPGPKPKEK